MFIAMVSTTTTKQVVYNTSEFPGFFCYILRARISFGCIENFNLEKKINEKKNTSLELRQVTGPGMVSPRITRGGPARGRMLCSLTPYYPGVRKEDINLLNILLLLLLLLRNLLPQQHATSSIPISRSVTQSFPAGVWKSVSNLYPLSCCCRHVDCSISYLSLPITR